MRKIAFDALDGTTALLYGADGHRVKLDGRVFEAVEDPEDGYRSCLDTVVERAVGKGFLALPLARVRIERERRVESDPVTVRHGHGKATLKPDRLVFDGWRLVDVDSHHVWLRFGTNRDDSHYPCFVFTWAPDPDATTAHMERLAAG